MLPYKTPFFIQKNNIYIIPIIHYNMETAAHTKIVFDYLSPDCVAVELAETMELQLLHAASRLPDISLVVTQNRSNETLYYMCEPCDAAFEGLRCALEKGVVAKCIDLDVNQYQDIKEHLPDPYSIYRIGLKNYYEAYRKIAHCEKQEKCLEDRNRETYMARRLKELSFSHDKILFVCGMAHVENILKLMDNERFPDLQHADRKSIELCTLTEDSIREVMAEYGWLSNHYEHLRSLELSDNFPPDRQQLIFNLYKEASANYEKSTGHTFSNYHLRNTMKFVRNYALTLNMLQPNLFQILTAAKGCVDHNYAYEVWLLATSYPHLKNIDNLPTLNLTAEEVWGNSKIIRFHMKSPSRKRSEFMRRKKDRSDIRFQPPGPFSICSFEPEDVIIENFGRYLQKKGIQTLREEGARIIPFTTSLEDGIDTRETIRHWYEKKLYVKSSGKPPGAVGSVVVIFDEDKPDQLSKQEKFPWRATWLGENEQESDMALYATDTRKNVVGPGISRCEYGGFMMTYPPRRLWDVWNDPDYADCQSKSEVLLMSAIDYAQQNIIVYVAEKPPLSRYKSFANRYGKKIVYLPIGQLSPITLNKIRTFHVLDGHDKRKIADEYIY